jgi:hypothetical protein
MQGNTNDNGQELHNIVAKKPLYPIYFAARSLRFDNPSAAYQLLDEAHKDLSIYSDTPEIWHNIAIIAARVQHNGAELAFVLAGLGEWPNDVDLLCDALQLFRTSSYDPDRAADIWKRLQAMDRNSTGPFWRFWVFGAIYLAQDLHQREEGVKLLDEGLRSVRRDGLMDVLRSYRQVLLDTPPSQPYANEGEMKLQYAKSIETIEARYRLGIDLGVENGYVLALDLAKLLQERAGAQEKESGKARDFLKQALDYLDLAESMYTANANHPISDIYNQRASIYMAQHRYGDALRLLQSIKTERVPDPQSYVVMRKYAAVSSGGQDSDA